MLERAKISAEMKDLDQASRATLRKYGVRFGAYHIYFPALLKPAARALASLLWAEKQDNVDMSALSGAQHLASGPHLVPGRQGSLPRDAYRVLGYRQCGERAVRVDILERLADLIRPALAWRENSPGEKPTGAFDGRGFVVTQAMTSLTGSAGEDFASILRALGYRMDKRPPLPPKPAPVVETVSAETPPVEASARGRTRDAGGKRPQRKTSADPAATNGRRDRAVGRRRCCRQVTPVRSAAGSVGRPPPAEAPDTPAERGAAALPKRPEAAPAEPGRSRGRRSAPRGRRFAARACAAEARCC